MRYLPEEGQAIIRSFWKCELDKESFVKKSKFLLANEVSIFAWALFHAYFDTLFFVPE